MVLLIYLFAIIDGHIREMFYAAEHLDKGETGLAIYQAVINRFEKDGWTNHLDNFLLGIASDGATSMVSTRGAGFAGRMQSRIEEHRLLTTPKKGIPTRIPHVHCVAHRLELIMKKSFKIIAEENDNSADWAGTVSSVINQVASFYSNIAATRLESLRHTAVDLELSGSIDHMLRLKRDFEVRWTASALESRKTFTRMYKIIWENLLEWDNDLTKMTESTIATERNIAFRAKTFLMILKNISFYQHLTFQVGILNCANFLSQEAQRADSTLIDLPYVFSEFEKCIRVFTNDPFNPYTPQIRDSKRKKSVNAVTNVAFMRNVVALTATGTFPIQNSAEGKMAIFGARSTTLDSLRFRLDFPSDKSTTAAASASKDTVFDPIIPIKKRRTQTVDKSGQAYEEEKARQAAEAREELNAEKSRDSQLYQKFQSANLVLLHSTIRKDYGDTIIKVLKEKLNDEIMEQAASFTVKKLIFDVNFGTALGAKDKENRRKMSELFNVDADKVEEEIVALRLEFTTQISADKRKEMESAHTDLVLFHTTLLKTTCYGTELQTIISSIISLPLNSAGVERGFAIFNHYHSKRRSSLNIAHLEAYLLIHINGPSPEMFVADEYVSEWLKSHLATEHLDSNGGEGHEETEEITEDDDDAPNWNDAFSSKKDVPPITIYN